MQITLSPVRGLPGVPETSLVVAGNILTVDGIAYDLSLTPEGGEALMDLDTPFIGPITREAGEVRCTVRVLLGDTAAPTQPSDPAHWRVTIADGAIVVPAVQRELPEVVIDDHLQAV